MSAPRKLRIRFSLAELQFLHDLLGVELEAHQALGTEGSPADLLASDLYGRLGRIIQSHTAADCTNG